MGTTLTRQHAHQVGMVAIHHITRQLPPDVGEPLAQDWASHLEAALDTKSPGEALNYLCQYVPREVGFRLLSIEELFGR